MSTKFFVKKVEKVDGGNDWVFYLAYSLEGIVIAQPIVCCEDGWQLAKKFDVKSPQRIAGHSFQLEINDPLLALEYLILGTRNNCVYVPPSLEEVRTKVAEALAKFKVPDLSKIDSLTVMNAFLEIWRSNYPDLSWFDTFAGQIAKLSGGNAKLSGWPIDSKKIKQKMPNAAYLLLTSKGGRKSMVVIMRPDLPVQLYLPEDLLI